MPFIHVYSYSGRSLEAKQQAAEALVKAASEAMGAPISAFTVVFEDVEQERWEADVRQAIIGPLADKLILDRGELL
jgi:phenylpyruvate tautomerase PptA (4-oxalocrotonate tautomerase family)